MQADPYAVLGIPRGVSEADVRQQYALLLGDIRRKLAQGEKVDPSRLDALRTAFKALTQPIEDTGTYARPHVIAKLAPQPTDTIWKKGEPSTPPTRWRDRTAARGFLIGVVLGVAALLVAWIVLFRG